MSVSLHSGKGFYCEQQQKKNQKTVRNGSHEEFKVLVDFTMAASRKILFSRLI